MSASPSHTYTNDILGNRAYRDYGGGGQIGYTWDVLNRLVGYAQGYEHMDYTYRADGMRVRRSYVEDVTHEELEEDDYTMWYAYDGQMQVDFYELFGDSSYLRTSYGLGARGIDYIETYNGSTTVKGFPIYDGHGNMIATIGRSGSGPYYALSDQRSYDVWGQIRSGNATGDPKMRYCANLGHPTDDESGLIYMRARYYEPWTGRFISEDPARHGANYFIYCRNNPVNLFDFSGCEPNYNAITRAFLAIVAGMLLSKAGYIMGLMDIQFLAVWFLGKNSPSGELVDPDIRKAQGIAGLVIWGLMGVALEMLIHEDTATSIAKEVSPTTKALGLVLLHVGFLEMFMALEEM